MVGQSVMHKIQTHTNTPRPTYIIACRTGNCHPRDGPPGQCVPLKSMEGPIFGELVISDKR